MELFVYGTLRQGTPWYDEMVQPFIIEEATREGSLPYTLVGGGAIFRHGGIHDLHGYYYLLDDNKNLDDMWEKLDDHESSPAHFRKIKLTDSLCVYEWNFETRGYTPEQVEEKAKAEQAALMEGR